MAERPSVELKQLTTITQEQKQALRQKTAFALPDNPTMRGMKPAQIKKYLYSAIIDFDDKYITRNPSIVGIIETLISETNEALGNSSSYLDAVLDYIEEKVNELDNDLQPQITANKTATETNARNIDGLNEALANETTARQTRDAELTALITALQNAGYITKEVSNLTNYYLKTETYNKAEIDEVIALLKALDVEFLVVEELPTTGKGKIIYLVPTTDGTGNNIYEEYIWLNGKWENIGSTKVNLADYYTKLQIDEMLKGYAPKHFEGTMEECEQAIASGTITDGTICIIYEEESETVTVAILGKAVLGQMILGQGE